MPAGQAARLAADAKHHSPELCPIAKKPKTAIAMKPKSIKLTKNLFMLIKHPPLIFHVCYL